MAGCHIFVIVNNAFPLPNFLPRQGTSPLTGKICSTPTRKNRNPQAPRKHRGFSFPRGLAKRSSTNDRQINHRNNTVKNFFITPLSSQERSYNRTSCRQRHWSFSQAVFPTVRCLITWKQKISYFQDVVHKKIMPRVPKPTLFLIIISRKHRGHQQKQ